MDVAYDIAFWGHYTKDTIVSAEGPFRRNIRDVEALIRKEYGDIPIPATANGDQRPGGRVIIEKRL